MPAAPRDDDFGIPLPGRLLPLEQWARTALKRLPTPGPLDWAQLFGRSAPVVLDLGCGNGRFLVLSALRRPECDHLGVDILPVVIRYATRRANQRGLHNARLAVIGGEELLANFVPPGSVAEIHIYHPQPYRDDEWVGERLLSPRFFELAQAALAPGGLFVIQTDNRGYWKYIRQTAPHYFDFCELDQPWPDAPAGRSRREIYARQRGLTIFRGEGRKPDGGNAAHLVPAPL